MSDLPTNVARIAPDGDLSPRQKRRMLLEMTLRRVKRGTGSSDEFMMGRTAAHKWPDLRTILAGMDWVIVGGVATRAYMPERVTQDMHILIRARDQQQVLQRLRDAGYTIGQELGISGRLVTLPDGIEIDVLFGDQTWLDEALRQPEQDPAGYPVLALPYLVLHKLAASRAQDIADISRMLGWADESELDKVRAVVAQYSPEDIEDLESLIYLGQQERE